MPKPKDSRQGEIKVKKKKDNIKGPDSSELKEELDSGFSGFIKKPLPSEKEVKQMDEYVQNEVKDEQVNDSLSEIYQDEKGKMVDVGKLEIQKKGFFSWLLTSLLFVFVIAASLFLVYNYIYLPSLTDSTAVSLRIEGEEEVFAGEEFSYDIYYENNSGVELENVSLEIKYPDNFVILDGTSGSENYRSWQFDRLPANYKGSISVKGKIVAPVSYAGILLANIIYTPSNFSSEFRKESSFVSTVLDTGLNFNIDYISSVMINEENDIKIKYKQKDENYINSFRLSIQPLENMDFINYEPEEDSGYKIIRPGVFEVEEIKDGEGEIILKLVFNEKLNEDENLIFNFSQADSEGAYKDFYTEEVSVDIIKGDLDLTMIVNGEKNDQGVGFGERLNYSVVYANEGETPMNDVVIMAVMDSEFLDWTSLSDENNGDVSGNTITWTKEEIPGLATLETGSEGFIDFSLNMAAEPDEIFPEKDYAVRSYAQYRFASSSADAFENESNKSNTIVNKISSDLELEEEVRYFNDDNISVGSGPIPPKVGQKTTYKIYWTLSNNLHGLDNVEVSLDLPDYIEYESGDITTSGNIVYSNENNSLRWEIGSMPVTMQRTRAEFSISVIPTEEDADKIMILSSGAEVKAHDSEADIDLSLKEKASTSRLKEDPIAVSDGIIVD